MGPRWLGPALLPLLLQAAAAADEPAVQPPSMQDYFIIFVIGILALCLFVVILARIFKGSDEQLSRLFIVKVLGTALGMALIAAGSAFIISDLLLLITVFTPIRIFVWALDLMTPFFQWIAEIIAPVTGILPLPLPTLILIFLGIIGLAIFLLGLFVLVKVRGSPFYTKKGMPTKSRFITFREVIKRGTEPLNPTVTFRVVDKYTREPSPDVKVMLKQKEGERVYSKYTDFNGEVVFQKIEGTYSTYYAFVEGDQDRSKYRVIRTSIDTGTEPG
jgi:hypothetical protein